MAVKALPGSPFEVVQPKFLFQLLTGLLSNPSCLDSPLVRSARDDVRLDHRVGATADHQKMLDIVTAK
jgi:hypothetical protein